MDQEYIIHKLEHANIKLLKCWKNVHIEVNQSTFFPWVLFCLLWLLELFRTSAKPILEIHFINLSKPNNPILSGQLGNNTLEVKKKKKKKKLKTLLFQQMMKKSFWMKMNQILKRHCAFKYGFSFCFSSLGFLNSFLSIAI